MERLIHWRQLCAAIPEREAVERAWRKLRLTVQVASKLNRSHLIDGEVTYLLPYLGRVELEIATLSIAERPERLVGVLPCVVGQGLTSTVTELRVGHRAQDDGTSWVGDAGITRP